MYEAKGFVWVVEGHNAEFLLAQLRNVGHFLGVIGTCQSVEAARGENRVSLVAGRIRVLRNLSHNGIHE